MTQGSLIKDIDHSTSDGLVSHGAKDSLYLKLKGEKMKVNRCKWCGEWFEIKPFRMKYCSPSCQENSYQRNKPKTPEERKKERLELLEIEFKKQLLMHKISSTKP